MVHAWLFLKGLLCAYDDAEGSQEIQTRRRVLATQDPRQYAPYTKVVLDYEEPS